MVGFVVPVPADNPLAYNLVLVSLHFDSSIENLHLACYTESLVVVLFLLPHKFNCDLDVVKRIFVWYNTNNVWTNTSHTAVTTSVCIYEYMFLW